MSKAPGDQISLIFFFNYLHMYIFFEYYFCEKNPIDNETKHEVFLQRYFLSLKLKRECFTKLFTLFPCFKLVIIRQKKYSGGNSTVLCIQYTGVVVSLRCGGLTGLQ